VHTVLKMPYRASQIGSARVFQPGRRMGQLKTRLHGHEVRLSSRRKRTTHKPQTTIRDVMYAQELRSACRQDKPESFRLVSERYRTLSSSAMESANCLQRPVMSPASGSERALLSLSVLTRPCHFVILQNNSFCQAPLDVAGSRCQLSFCCGHPTFRTYKRTYGASTICEGHSV
jgi:hypothetical protein